MFTNPIDHLYAELERLDLLLHRQILRLRAAYQLSLDEFRGLYISDQQVDSLIYQTAVKEGSIPTVLELTEHAEAIRKVNAENLSDNFPWKQLVREFNLTQFEQDVLLLALAPEIDLKYETLYAYLNNDVTRKWPTCDLALRLFSRDPLEQMSRRKYLLSEATLFGSGLLQPVQPTPERPPSWLACGFSLAPSVSNYILGFSFQDLRLTSFVEHRIPKAGWAEVPLSDDLCRALRQVTNLFKHSQPDRPGLMLIFEGRYGSGRALATEALCQDLGVSLLRVDMEAVRASPEPLPKVMQALMLQQRLNQAGVYVEHFETLFDKEGNPLPEGYRVLRQLTEIKGPIFFACEPGTRWHELMKGQRFLAFPFGGPDFTQRLKMWERYLSESGNEVSQETLKALADRFVLTPGQIKDTVSAAGDARRLEGSAEALSGEALFEAARAQSDRSLGNLAPKMNTIHTWDDLVLPPITLRHVKEVSAAIKYRHVVYSEWGFERRISSGKGLKVLFAGASGTGKTMTAGVIAKDLELDLYKIDLSGVVSKYIGETEKNLDRIFRAAQCSNAILFFDEADALYGKRSEVKDAHDRYANIEVAYLLQKLEEHEGAVILASNLSKNIDDAFSRRMHYVVEFPLPDETYRERLWRGMFPPQVPLGGDVDFRFLAKQFSISGGDIKNVALDAAFLAAQDGQMVTMKHLIRAMARQMIKEGRIPSPADFKQYHALIVQA